LRYYSLEIIEASSGNVIRHWTSHPNGIYAAPDPGALNIECDLLVYPYATVAPTGSGDFGNSHIRVWGIPLADIAQAANWSAPSAAAPTYTVKFSGGMGKGLPLANPAQAGLIVQGDVWRAFGNWIGTEMTLDFFISPLSLAGAASVAAATTPAVTANNLVLNWPKNTPLAAPLKSALQTAYPGVPVQISISPNLLLTRDEAHWAPTLGGLADMVNRRSVAILGPNNPSYTGVHIAARLGTIIAFDGTGGTDTNSTGGTTAPASSTIAIAFTDLIGQPTWIGNGVIQVTTVLRADVHQSDKITLPPGLTTIAAGGANLQASPQYSAARFSSQFQGTFTVQQVRHVGNYKAPSGAAWVTTIQAITAQGAAVAQG
jgi:hypothetical protein